MAGDDLDPNPRRDFLHARSMLRTLERRRNQRAQARERVLEMMASLDLVIAQLPEALDPGMLSEIERVVITLRTADQSIEDGQVRSGLQSLDLARARIERLLAAVQNAPSADDRPKPA